MAADFHSLDSEHNFEVGVVWQMVEVDQHFLA
jgi:hypothetical protein